MVIRPCRRRLPRVRTALAQTVAALVAPPERRLRRGAVDALLKLATHNPRGRHSADRVANNIGSWTAIAAAAATRARRTAGTTGVRCCCRCGSRRCCC